MRGVCDARDTQIQPEIFDKIVTYGPTCCAVIYGAVVGSAKGKFYDRDWRIKQQKKFSENVRAGAQILRMPINSPENLSEPELRELSLVDKVGYSAVMGLLLGGCIGLGSAFGYGAGYLAGHLTK